MDAQRLRWLERKERIEEKETMLADQLQARLYRNHGRQTQHKKETLRQTKHLKAEEDRLKYVAEELQSLRVPWKKASNRILNSIDKANTIGRREELSKKLNNLAKDTETKIVDLSEKVVKRVKESDSTDG